MTHDMTHDMNDKRLTQGETAFRKSAVRKERTLGPQGANSWSVRYGLRALRYVVFLMMMVVGVGEMWGQGTPAGTDRSGYYYIANFTGDDGTTKGYNENTPLTNYYLCPAKPDPNAGDGYFYGAIYYDYDDASNSNQMPYLTTYKTGKVNEALWKIEFAATDNTDPNNPIDYYYIRYFFDNNKYLTHNTSRAAANTRYTVHLQTTSDGNNSMFCFETGTDGSYYIRPRSVSSGNRHLNPATGNKNFYYGTGANNKKTTIDGNSVDPGGMIGFYTHNAHRDDQASQWYLEKVPPTISYNSSNLIEISYIDGDATIYYTTDGTEPPTSGEEHIYGGAAFDPPAGTTMIKAIAVNNGKESGVATFTPLVLLGNSHKYLIQAQGNGWTTGDFQGCHYYMIPGDVESSITKVNTTSMLRPSMQWYFLNAGDNYYYIVNNVDNTRMRYNTTNGVHMDTWDDSNANEFKFKIVESATAGTYNIIPYGVTTGNMYLNKDSGNTGANALILHSSATNANSRWKFVPQDTPLADTPPFTPSGANTSVYYKIRNGNGTTYHITPPASEDGNATASTTDDATVSWYFIKVEDPTAADWLAYYKIINAGTGKALYYAYTANNSPCLKAGTYDGNNDNYKFAFVKSTTDDYYYIVPKSHKDDQLNNISTFSRSNSSILPATTRAASGNVWTFIPADLFCNDPEFVEEGGVIKIKCNTNAANIYINTESNADPDNNSTLYAPTPSTQNWATADKVRIKAIAVVSDGTTPVSSSVITLLNNPDVTLAGGPYDYKGTVWEPAVTVSVGEGISATTAASNTYDVAYAYNINVGTATVTVTDADAGDSWYIWNVADQTFTITPAALTVTANNKTIGYGDEAANDGVNYSGFVNSETETALDGELSYSYNTASDGTGTAYTPYDSPIGTYHIIPTGLTSTNYAITFVPGTLTVEQKSIGDGTNPALGITIDIVKNGNDTYTTTVKQNGTNTPLVEGTSGTNYDYSITPTGNASSKYYEVTITGANNYTGSAKAKFANITLSKVPGSGDGGAATFVTNSSGDADYATPANMTTYVITGINASAGTVTVEPLDYIPENVPVLLVSTVDTNGFQVMARSGGTNITNTQKDENLLTKATGDYAARTFATAEIYLLYMGEFVLNAAGTLPEGKVYLSKPSGASPVKLYIDWDLIDGIDEHWTMDDENSRLSTLDSQLPKWYTLDGRCLGGKPTKRGLYLHDGQKIVISGK